MMEYGNAVEYIKLISKRGSCPGLERIEKLLEIMGNPQDKVGFIHVTGTNGKGSVCAMLSSVLCSGGYNTGLFTSPYIVRVNESIQVNGEEISDADFADVIEYIKSLAEAMTDKPTEFEVLTAAAFEYFSRKHCEIAVIECGMGGELDATNVVRKPLLSIITNVAADHLSYLGETTEKIAIHKSGIIKPKRPVVFGGNDLSAKRVIFEKSESFNSHLYNVDYSLLSNIKLDISGTTFNFGHYNNVKISLLGAYQPYNCAVVLTAIDVLCNMSLEINQRAIYSGLSKTMWRGRFEILSKNPSVIFDGSHNPEGIKYAVESIQSLFAGKKVNVLMGVMADKDYVTMVGMLSSVVNEAFTVTPNNSRALSCEKLASVFTELDISAKSYDKICDGVSEAMRASAIDECPLVVLGSLYMYDDVIKAMR